MRNLVRLLWKDDTGAIIAAEYLLIGTILVIGIMVGLASIRDAIVTELSELGNSYLALSQGYVLSGQSACCAATDGSQALDTPCLVADPVCGNTCDGCWGHYGGYHGGHGGCCGHGNGGNGSYSGYYGYGGWSMNCCHSDCWPCN